MRKEILIPAMVLVTAALVVGSGCDKGRESATPEPPSASASVEAKKEAPQGPETTDAFARKSASLFGHYRVF